MATIKALHNREKRLVPDFYINEQLSGLDLVYFPLQETNQHQLNERNMGNYRKMFPTQDPNPPQYVDKSTSLSLPRNSAKCTPLEQLRRYIIEIMGFTFDADFTLLNKALGQTAPCTCPPKSILTPEERTKLLSLATLIKEVKPKMTSDNAWLTVRCAEREAIADAVVRPAHYVGLEVGELRIK